MMPTQRVLIVIFLTYLVQGSASDGPAAETYEPRWVYKCKEGCQREEQPRSATSVSAGHYESLSVCRTVCGRFGGLWPKPISAALSTQTVKIHPNHLRFDMIDVPSAVRSILVLMTQVVTQNLLAECRGNVTEVVDTPVIVHFEIKSEVTTLNWETDEQYMLDIQTKEGKVTVNIVAETVYGARHALESFVQLVAPDMPDHTDDYVCSLNIVTGAKVRDRPVYRHRGLLLDTSRNFIPLENIKKMIDGMAASKMNVFHWHVTDSHSFPLESLRVPQLTRYGAYSAYEIYSAEEVRQLVKYAQVRGVRVVIEIDSPAHAGNGWQWGMDYDLGNLAVCVNSKDWHSNCIQPPCGQLNPANQYVYTVLKNLYRDIADALEQPALLHIGGDEVYLGCWNKTKEITDYMAIKGYDRSSEGFMKLWSEFHEKALQAWDEALASVNVRPQPVMIWSSELTQVPRIQQYLNPARYVIEVWEPVASPLLQQLIHLYRVVSVPKDIWYLDHGFWGTTKYSNWKKMYGHTLPANPNVLGGEVAMWSEYVDENALDGRVWPRAAAVAERLWSNPTTGADVAEPRLQRLRERLINRGLRPDVLSPAWCAQHDLKCL